MHARIDALTRPRFWSLLPSIILDWVVITVSVSPSVDATKHADTSRECYLEYFMCRPHRTDLLLVGAREHYSGCTSLHLRKRIATGATHHPPAWHTSHIYHHIRECHGMSRHIIPINVDMTSSRDIMTKKVVCKHEKKKRHRHPQSVINSIIGLIIQLCSSGISQNFVDF